MMGEIVVRRARADELDAVAALHRRSREDAMPFMRGMHTVDEDRAFFRERVFAACDVWVAEFNGEPAGMCAVRPGWIDHLYVDPKHQRRGIGTALLREALAANETVQLWTFLANDRAIAFYEARGFVRIRETDGAGNEEHQPDALYAYRRP